VNSYLNPQPAIETLRLVLQPFSALALQTYLDRPQEFETKLGCNLSRAILNESLQRAIKMKLEKIAQSAVETHLWLTYWLILIRKDRFGAGMVGFKGKPDVNGEVEIGYGIDPSVQNHGYTTEAVQAMIGWAFQHAECKTITAINVPRQNRASCRVLEKVGMHVFEETQETLSWRINKSV
jgi:ribosomal-protein-alanine N-acetyltransferase